MRRGRKAAGRPLLIGALALAVVGGTLGLYWFQPWKLWQDETVDEALPGAVTTASPPGAVTTSPPPAAAPAPSPTRDAGPRTVAGGELVSHEHSTSGTAQLVRLTDGSHVVRLENLDTSNGPDVHVWLTDAPVKEGKAGWHLFDDGEYVDLGKLKGNKGSQNYVVPADVDPSRYSSVSVWCDRFNVSFGAAELARA
ncbi:DM13 domain-containing protein [Streptomyces violaceoruber]|uniref:DM13 domain-containing protein n=1 Tax=Streptomyces TaxID=1883 RepID=UPI000B83D9A6|nr:MULTISPECIES: DM13 domain-containing protein [unclassified Streptomyces]MDX3322882.1 DM13 domain-containing protein [Streptomyces sp. ME03-5684b]MDX3369753.1 DM13 domain-containing protein [Streptomyces sp. ME02-6987-2C]MDX3404122.1 DM13 domain-containing protein [Streptomyces sp. ME01-18h]MDX3425617.1 DM13 domain-containing protein [Streptomyces sp. ME02-6985-2c]REH18496.1 electron transfer DM13 [Streptomyces sp. 2221.1]